jgi:hypothetical protein
MNSSGLLENGSARILPQKNDPVKKVMPSTRQLFKADMDKPTYNMMKALKEFKNDQNFLNDIIEEFKGNVQEQLIQIKKG